MKKHVHHSTNAARTAYPNHSGIVEVLRIMFVQSDAPRMKDILPQSFQFFSLWWL